ncbi:MAG TPA: phosphatase PAP2 family protein [Polyangiaceae bacterium]
MKPTALVRVASVAAGLSLTTVARADPATVEWSKDWPRVKLWEVAAAAALTIGDTVYEEDVPLPKEASWTQPILFDTWARNVFRADNAGVQSAASTSTDIMFKAGALVPFLVDDYFAALSIHQNVEVAWQLTVIDFESLGISGLVSLAAEHGVGRARPYTLSCVNGKVLDPQGGVLQECGTGNDNRSFFSGHAAATSTVAGLVCVHHQHLPLFGGGFADLAPCLFMIGVSATTGILRLAYDEHWASDVMIGWADGFLSGYVLPSVLHFGFGSGRPLGQIKSGSLVMAPTVLSRPGGAELGMVGAF